MTQDALLIALRIKGFAKADVIAGCLSAEIAEIETHLTALDSEGLVAATKIGVKLTPSGQAKADAASAAERAACDAGAIDAAYDAFCDLNAPFKALISDWQSRDGAPNDHSDADYDASVIARLKAMHVDAIKLTNGLADLAPRLGQYARRLNTALAKINLGEARFVAAPIIDSYHTVWFELHEDLIRFSGRTRAEEALAGRAV